MHLNGFLLCHVIVVPLTRSTPAPFIRQTNCEVRYIYGIFLCNFLEKAPLQQNILGANPSRREALEPSKVFQIRGHSFHPHNKSQKSTWTHPRFVIAAVIDMALVRRTQAKFAADVRAMPGTGIKKND